MSESLFFGGFRFELTSPACPEQYDVYDANNKRVGYVRMRSGRFLFYFIDAHGFRHDMIVARVQDSGSFADDAERARWLGCCADCLGAVTQWAEYGWSNDDRALVDSPPPQCGEGW